MRRGSAAAALLTPYVCLLVAAPEVDVAVEMEGAVHVNSGAPTPPAAEVPGAPLMSGTARLKTVSNKAGDGSPQDGGKGAKKRVLPQRSNRGKRTAGAEPRSGRELVGAPVEVWWALDKRYFAGTIAASTRVGTKYAYDIQYADGDFETGCRFSEYTEVVRDGQTIVQARNSPLPPPIFVSLPSPCSHHRLSQPPQPGRKPPQPLQPPQGAVPTTLGWAAYMPWGGKRASPVAARRPLSKSWLLVLMQPQEPVK